MAEKRHSNVLSLKWRAVAPIPKATLASLCVANATLNGNPRNISAGNCNSPAPPPAKAENALAIKETMNKRRYSYMEEKGRKVFI